MCATFFIYIVYLKSLDRKYPAAKTKLAELSHGVLITASSIDIYIYNDTCDKADIITRSKTFKASNLLHLKEHLKIFSLISTLSLKEPLRNILRNLIFYSDIK